jgi:hypothetical protein
MNNIIKCSLLLTLVAHTPPAEQRTRPEAQDVMQVVFDIHYNPLISTTKSRLEAQIEDVLVKYEFVYRYPTQIQQN